MNSVRTVFAQLLELLPRRDFEFAIDSTTIDLCLKLFTWALFRGHKAGIKVHT